MAGCGAPQRDIGLVLGISDDSLAKHYPELDRGMARQRQGRREPVPDGHQPDPSGPTVTAAIFWAKTRMGWREVQHIEQTLTTARRAEEMSDDELASHRQRGRISDRGAEAQAVGQRPVYRPDLTDCPTGYPLGG